jgi:PAS domain S-box-containing protein
MVILHSKVSIVPAKDKAAMATGNIHKQLIQERIRELRENTDFLSTLLENLIGYAIIAADFDGNIIAYNEGARQIYGYDPEEVIGEQGIDIFFTREFIEAGDLQQIVNELIEKGRFSCEGEKVRKNGEKFPAQILFTLTRDKSGKVVGFIEIVEDLTGRKRTEKRLCDSMSNFYKVINDDPDGIIITNQEGIVRYVNSAAESLYRRKREDFNREKFGFPITSSDVTVVDITRQAGETVVAEMRVSETTWYGEIAHLISLRDISERKHAQQVQERLSQQLQAKVSELETFSYGIAHDLRSPLVSIEGFSRLLRDDMQNHDAERVQEDIRLLDTGVRKMQQFLNRTLEYSRAGQLVNQASKISFGKIVKELVAEFNGQISSIGAAVSLADKFPRVYADKVRIAEVLTNLIQNSIKYRNKTVPLKIEIGYQLSEGEVVFFVRDNGTGIEESEIEKVFGLFYRGSTEGEGSGTGLAIVKKIIEAHGGRVWVQQGRPGEGTTICFTLAQHNGTNKGDNNGKD